MDKEGVIWKVSSPDPDKFLVLSSLRQEVMSTIHDIPSSGHQGVQRTKAKAREMFNWWKMGTDIKTYLYCLLSEYAVPCRHALAVRVIRRAVPWKRYTLGER